MQNANKAKLSEMQRLLKIMAQLRDPQSGCPWDVKQTMESLTRYTIEEAYEVADAIANGDMHDIKDELGDLLFQVVFYAQIASESRAFSFDDVAKSISDKLISLCVATLMCLRTRLHLRALVTQMKTSRSNVPY
jgi:ATP diphosphatase